MEAMEEATAVRPAADAVAKGRRTKRQRLNLLLPAPAAVSVSTSSTNVSGTTTTTEEEEDMANCLILLAQGRVGDRAAAAAAGGGGSPEKFTSRRFAEAATTNGKAGFYVYECKTCSKCFPSFQALGGHRASHKKPRVSPPSPEDKKPPLPPPAPAAIADEDGLELSMNSFSKPFISTLGNTNTNTNTNTSNKQQRVHECSVCGSEFSSGQALGGHMRRHRQVMNAKEAEGRNHVLSLDLNLPAPSDDVSDFSKSAFGFAGEIQSTSKLVFSPSALVDCHY